MPKEIISRPEVFISCPDGSAEKVYGQVETRKYPPGTVFEKPRTVSVRWGGDGEDGHVTIEQTTSRTQSELSVDEETGESFIRTPSPDPVVVWDINLSRSEINSLIRNLRRARDAVFGSDE